METAEISTINAKIAVTADVITYITENARYAREIIADLPRSIAQCVRYKMLNEFAVNCDAKGIDCGYLKAEDIPFVIGEVLECWCCNKPLSSCLMLLEEGWTTTKHETDPFVFDRARSAGMTYVDESGQERMYSCGFSYS